MEIKNELASYGLTEEQYEACLKDIRDKVNGFKDIDWAEIVDKYKLNIHSDTLRKASQTIFGGAFVTRYFGEKNLHQENEKCYLTELRAAKEEVQKERQKFRDEKLEYNKWIREQARDELICEKLCDAIRELDPLPLPEVILSEASNGNWRTGILCFGDTHYGVEYAIKGLHGETINAYSPEVFEARMQQLLEKVIYKVKREGMTEIKVYSLGDELDGILRCSQLMKLRYGVVEAAIKYADYICKWLNELTKYVRVDFQMVNGNHTELRMLNQPKGTFTKDNMGEIIKEFIKVRLADNINFNITTTESGLIFDKVQGFNVLGIHGEVKSLAKALQNFSTMYNTQVDILIGAHQHHQYSETVGVNKDVVSVPSVIGVDDYSMTIGKTSNPGATFLIVENGLGVVEQTAFKFTV